MPQPDRGSGRSAGAAIPWDEGQVMAVYSGTIRRYIMLKTDRLASDQK